MPLLDISPIQNVDEAFQWVNARDVDSVAMTPMAERILNSAALLLENLANRPIKPRTLVDYKQNGTGRRSMVLDKYPVNDLSSLVVQDQGRFTSYTVPTSGVVVQKETGTLTLLPQTIPAIFLFGHQNITMTITVGLDPQGMMLAEMAQLDIFGMMWNRMGCDPLVQSRSDNIGTSSTFSLASFDELPQIAQQFVQTYRNWQV